MYEAAQALLWLVAAGFVVWLLAAFGIALAATKRPAMCAAIFVTLAAAPPGYFFYQSHEFNSGLDELRASNERQVKDAEAYLVSVCQTQRTQVSSRRVTAAAGVRIDVDQEQRITLVGAPSPLPETPEMRRNQKRYGESYPRSLNERQYRVAIHWVRNVFADSVLIESRFAFVEEISPYLHPRELRATARKRWWLETGRSLAARPQMQELDRRLEDLQDAENYWLSWPIADSTAKYTLHIEDISTLEDRKNWVARGRVRLIDRASSEVVAEYVGFAANLSPAYVRGDSYPWERSIVCPGVEREHARERQRWNVLAFFFRDVVQYE